MIFQTVVPILYSRDIPTSLAWYTGILGFTKQWAWGDPPTFGGICKDSVEVFFSKDGQGHPGTWISVMVDNVDEYFGSVMSKGAKALHAPQSMEWGVREFLIEDPDENIIRFGQNIYKPDREHPGHSKPDTIRIIEKQPDRPIVVYSLAAEDTATGETIGGAKLLGDNAGFFYVKDVNVRPEWQGRGIGRALVQALTTWLDTNAPGKASVWLHTAEHLMPFYKQFGFVPVTGMARFL